MENKKNILIVGGVGKIGKILEKNLSSKYNLIISDILIEESNLEKNYLHIDVTHYNELIEKIPNNIDVIINLVGIPPYQDNFPNLKMMNEMVDVYIKGIYNVFYAAVKLGIKKVIYASSNHVTDYYEENGISSLNREITIDDYPFSETLYGSLKLCGESIGFAFHKNFGLSVICLRIGTVRLDEYTLLFQDKRYQKTILSQKDTIELFDKSVNTNIEFGIYYGVSDNPNKPWSIKNAIKELGYKPIYNSFDIMKKEIKCTEEILWNG